jgi:hypothetical protein
MIREPLSECEAVGPVSSDTVMALARGADSRLPPLEDRLFLFDEILAPDARSNT